MANTREEHLELLRSFFERLSQAGLSLNLAKSKFTQGTVTYLGYIVGSGCVRPKEANVDAILKLPVPQSRRQLMRFFGMSGHYRKFCPNFSTVEALLTALITVKKSFEWTSEAQQVFDHLKVFLSSSWCYERRTTSDQPISPWMLAELGSELYCASTTKTPAFYTRPLTTLPDSCPTKPHILSSKTKLWYW